MKNKRIAALGIALILLALVVGVAFAASGNKDGVLWVVIEGRSSRLGRDQPDHYKHYMEIYNSNDYAVRVVIGNAGWNSQFDRYLNAGETNHYPCIKDSYVIRVEKR
jgi:hypothetical protein